MDSRIINKALNVLTTENYSYNIVSTRRRMGRTTTVIHWGRKNTHMRDIGVFAEAVVTKAKQICQNLPMHRS